MTDPVASGEPSVPRTLKVAAALSWRLLVVAAALALVALALGRLSLVVLPLVAALFLTALLQPVAQRFADGGLPRALAALLALLTAAGALAGLTAFLAPRVVDQFERLDFNIAGGLDRIQDWLMDGPLGLSESQVADATESVLEEIRQQSDALTEQALGGAVLVLEVVAGALLAIVLCFFLLKDGRRIWNWLVELMPPDARAQANEVGERAWATLGGYLRGITLSAFVEAILIAILLFALGVPLVLTLAVLAFFGAYIPIVGAFVVGLLATLVALFSVGFTTALLVVIGFVVIQQLESNLLHPVIVGRSVKLHPMVVLLAVVAGAVLGGIIGAFLAVPIVAVAASILDWARNRGSTETPDDPEPGEGDPPGRAEPAPALR